MRVPFLCSVPISVLVNKSIVVYLALFLGEISQLRHLRELFDVFSFISALVNHFLKRKYLFL